MPPKIIPIEQQRERQRVGATLRRIRKLRGWKPDEFANQLGISRSYLANIEAGRKPLTDIHLARSARVLDCDQIDIKFPDRDGAVA